MPGVVNTARQGAAFERRIIHDLQQYGYDCIRSAASKGKVDVVAIGEAYRLFMGGVLFIQAKLTNPMISPAERIGIQDLALRAGALPLVSWWAADETTGLMTVHYRRLTGPGPKDWEPWAPGEDM